jgi:hypothetical protein
MTKSKSSKKKAENEAIFREYNESVQDGFSKLHELAKETGYKDLPRKTSKPLSFHCECADENCQKRINLTLQEYENVHSDRYLFTVMPGHDSPKIETVVRKEKEFWVVKKFEVPPEVDSILNKTDANHV